MNIFAVFALLMAPAHHHRSGYHLDIMMDKFLISIINIILDRPHHEDIRPEPLGGRHPGHGEPGGQGWVWDARLPRVPHDDGPQGDYYPRHRYHYHNLKADYENAEDQIREAFQVFDGVGNISLIKYPYKEFILRTAMDTSIGENYPV